MTSSTLLPITQLRVDGGTQLRADGSDATVAEYAADLLNGDTFPPVVAFHDGAEYWLADGFHRLEAHQKAGRTDIAVDVRQGSRRDAVLFAAGANANHGKRRTSQDKRNSIMKLLEDDEWRQWSDSEIGRRTNTDKKTVAKYRREMGGGMIDGRATFFL